MTEEVKKLDPNWQKRLEKVGKNTFQTPRNAAFGVLGTQTNSCR